MTRPILILILWVLPLASPGIARASAPDILWIEVHEAITPVSARYIQEGIRSAEAEGCQALILELDTPGGLDASMRNAVKSILASRVPVIVWVGPPGSRAASAGMFIALSAHLTAMAHSTSIGAAHPVAIGGAQGDSLLGAKALNDACSFARSVASMRGRNAEWAEDAVRRSSSLGAEEALAKGVVEILADDQRALLDALHHRTVAVGTEEKTLDTVDGVIRRREMGFAERLLAIVADPNVAYLLFLAGILGIFFELANPGAILPGVIGGIALILALFAFQSLPVSIAGVLLILLALVLFILEVKVMSHGVLAIGGIVSLLLGSLMLFRHSGGFLRVSWWVMIPALAITAAFFVAVVTLALRARTRGVSTGREGMIGMEAVVLTPLRPGAEGKVRMHGEVWAARASEEIHAGSRVRIVSVDGLVVTVALAKGGSVL